MAPESGTLASVLSATAEVMRAQLVVIRASLNHTGMIGSSAEEIVAQFLNQRLPASVRAVAGKAVDSTGSRSDQLDVIIYDTSRTPLLFTSANHSQNLVPVEGVHAVVEVKTKLTPEEVRRSAKNCASIKRLDRTAFYLNQTAPPIYYSVFSFESDGLYSSLLNDEIDPSREFNERIDSLVALDRGLSLNAAVSASAGTGEVATSFLASPAPQSIRVDVETPNSLVVWYAVVASTVMGRVPCPAIDIAQYLQDELKIAGTVSGTAVDRLQERLTAELAEQLEIDPQILLRIQRGELGECTVAEFYQLLRHPNFDFRDVDDETVRLQQRELQRTAAEMSLVEWARHWFQKPDS